MTAAEDRLWCLRQGGRELERYVEEFLELSNQVSWFDSALGVCFRLGQDDDVIGCDLHTYSFPLIGLVNHVLYLNGVSLKVEEVQSDHHPVPPENHRASPAHPSPGTLHIPGQMFRPPISSQHRLCPQPRGRSSVKSAQFTRNQGRRMRRKGLFKALIPASTAPELAPVRAPVPEFSPERAPVPEFSPERAPVPEFSPERAPVPEFSPEKAPVPEFSPKSAPVPTSSPRRAPVPKSRPGRATVSELGLRRPSKDYILPKDFFWGGGSRGPSVEAGPRAEARTPEFPAPQWLPELPVPPWPPELSAPLCLSELPVPPWPPERSAPPLPLELSAPPWLPSLPAPPWPSELSAPPWPPELSALPWLPSLPAPPWHPELPAPPWLPELPAPPWHPGLPDPPWRYYLCPSPAPASRHSVNTTANPHPPACVCAFSPLIKPPVVLTSSHPQHYSSYVFALNSRMCRRAEPESVYRTEIVPGKGKNLIRDQHFNCEMLCEVLRWGEIETVGIMCSSKQYERQCCLHQQGERQLCVHTLKKVDTDAYVHTNAHTYIQSHICCSRMVFRPAGCFEPLM
uniref:Uncharacterized protein n=1 Tax=Sinocyclocheilus rhinocerous TaxID=307959 RepID=A0A673KUF2_9TELE